MLRGSVDWAMIINNEFWNGRRPPSLSVDAIPFEIVESRKSGAWLTIVGMLGSAYALVVDKKGSQDSREVLALIIGVGICTVGVWRLFQPDKLRLSPLGIEYRNLWRRARWRWADVRNFRLYTGPVSSIQFDSTTSAGPIWLAPTWIAASWPGIGGQNLVNLLNHAKIRCDPNDSRQMQEASPQLAD